MFHKRHKREIYRSHIGLVKEANRKIVRFLGRQSDALIGFAQLLPVGMLRSSNGVYAASPLCPIKYLKITTMSRESEDESKFTIFR